MFLGFFFLGATVGLAIARLFDARNAIRLTLFCGGIAVIVSVMMPINSVLAVTVALVLLVLATRSAL
jgi:hypothetical protein